MGKGYKHGPSGGSAGGILTVNAPAGVTVTATKDGKTYTKTANADGVAIFKGLSTGTWTVQIADGEQTATQQVTIYADYSMVIAFFQATISVTYPEGSICTCSDGITTLTAPDTSGSISFIVPNEGTWTVSCSNDEDSTSEEVEITEDRQSKNVKLQYWDGVLYDSGTDFTEYTGGWSLTDGYNFSYNDDCLASSKGTVFTEKAIDVSNYSTLNFNILNNGGWVDATVGLGATRGTFAASATVPKKTNTATVYSIDISALTGEYYVGYIGGETDAQHTKVYKVWLIE